MVFAIIFSSLPNPTEKERSTVNGGWHVESAASATARPDERVETAALEEEMEIAVNDGGCARMAPNEPLVALPAAVVVGSAAVGGF